jgi:hypothetical protein
VFDHIMSAGDPEEESALVPPINWESHFKGFDFELLEHLLHHEPSFITYYLSQISDHRVIGTVGADMRKAQTALADVVRAYKVERRQSSSE